MATQTDHSRRQRILDAAEQAFAELGFAGTSLRAIVRLAKVNLATVYYYFGSKDGLMAAVLKRRFGPLREEQLELLRRKQAQAARGVTVPVAEVLEAILLPALRLVMDSDPRHTVARLIGRIATEPDPQTQAFLRSQNAPVRQAYLQALQLSLPGVSPRTLRWRLEFVFGALAFVLCNPGKLQDPLPGGSERVNARQILAEMLAFFSPGFQVHSQPPAPQSERSVANHAAPATRTANLRPVKRRRARVLHR